ncbi:conserved hypothetical protein [Theileria equi strain WA]|uniref:RRM domain-containing protein n=1 Tax=Theileria equi strain WA TaxID=1537102 RepID=L1LFA7_THEEQ|nr:conserved hypothetical protein [Theileria equi strain WA]EKX74041.1 conserved hypothetical protein [Theileria equi strain WA]|eukprot:XP_004833493.1 conserved hypothetical protein [Theileria equi strain WA]
MEKEGNVALESSASGDGYTVHISNIPSRVDESSLESVMGHFGKVRKCRLKLGYRQDSPAEAWVVYKDESELISALKADGKLDCGGCVLKISKWNGPIPSENAGSKRTLTEASTCQDSCWFCLSNTKCEVHMISYVSKHCYVAIAKGAISSMHTLVTPIYHFPSAASAPKDVQDDMQKIVDCLMDVALKSGMGAIAFERYVPMSMKVAMHTQIQVIPVPLELSMQSFDYVDRADSFADANRIDLDASDEPSFNCLSSKIMGLGQSYLYLQAVGKLNGKLTYSRSLWILNRKSGLRILQNFGREIALSLLSDSDVQAIPSLNKAVQETHLAPRQAAADWRNCIATKEDEESFAKNLTKSILSL